MKITELYRYLDEHIPKDLSCGWDNDGLMCCPNEEKEVKKVLITLDITKKAIDRAIAEGCELIISHHPLIFKGVKALNHTAAVPKRAIELIRADISAFSFHTRLDAVSGGVNDILAVLLGVADAEPFGEEGIGRIGELDSPMSLAEFASFVKERLGAPSVLCADAGRTVRRVALLGGAGADDIDAAMAAGADTYVSGEFSHHDIVDAPEGGINLIEAGHFFTEQPVCALLEELVRSADEKIEVVQFYSYEAMHV